MKLLKKISRTAPRNKVFKHSVSGILTQVKDSSQSRLVVWDISSKGLCIVINEQTSINETVSLAISKPVQIILKCNVIWQKYDKDKNEYLVGLKVLDNQSKLDVLNKFISQIAA